MLEKSSLRAILKELEMHYLAVWFQFCKTNRCFTNRSKLKSGVKALKVLPVMSYISECWRDVRVAAQPCTAQAGKLTNRPFKLPPC